MKKKLLGHNGVVPTLKDVAREANVHPTTASNILNNASGNSRFSDETRRRVETAARALGYVRNRAASGLRSQRSNTVGLVAGNLQNPFFALLAVELEKCLLPLGYELLLTSHGADTADDEERLAKTLFERAVDALLVWSETRGGRIARFSAPPCPCVYLGCAPPKTHSIAIGIERGLALAVDHLVRSGKRRLALYSPAYARDAGLPLPRPEILRDLCRRKRLPAPALYEYDGESWDLPAAADGAARILEASPAAEAVIGYNDVCASAWALASRRQGLSATVVGFDGTPLFRSLPDRFPYVDLRPAEIAAAAARLLHDLLDGKISRPKTVSVPPSFVIPAVSAGVSRPG